MIRHETIYSFIDSFIHLFVFYSIGLGKYLEVLIERLYGKTRREELGFGGEDLFDVLVPFFLVLCDEAGGVRSRQKEGSAEVDNRLEEWNVETQIFHESKGDYTFVAAAVTIVTIVVVFVFVICRCRCCLYLYRSGNEKYLGPIRVKEVGRSLHPLFQPVRIDFVLKGTGFVVDAPGESSVDEELVLDEVPVDNDVDHLLVGQVGLLVAVAVATVVATVVAGSIGGSGSCGNGQSEGRPGHRDCGDSRSGDERRHKQPRHCGSSGIVVIVVGVGVGVGIIDDAISLGRFAFQFQFRTRFFVERKSCGKLMLLMPMVSVSLLLFLLLFRNQR